MEKHVLALHMRDQTVTIEFSGTPLLMDVLQAEGIALAHPCGGRGVCKKCAVEVSGLVSQPNVIERQSGLRLSCQLRLMGDCEVTLSDTTASIAHADAGFAANAQLLAADIGTTTIEIKLFDADTGKQTRQEAALNPQAGFAADVIGRITAAAAGKGDMMLAQLEQALHAMIGDKAVVKQAVLTGNTVMMYLLTGRDPASLATAPFTADHLFGDTEYALGLAAYLPRCTGAFTGADLTCAILSSGMTDHRETSLLCDVGTNGEMALWHNGTLLVASAAVGPAFEGAGISCGMGGAPGAIDKVWAAQNMPDVHVIGGGEPKGICGSGLIDAAAVLLQLRLIDSYGTMEDEAVRIAGTIVLTQKDIRQLQLAKAAVAAGIELLMDMAGVDARDIKTLYIAGGFGSHLDVRSAAAIGLFPQALAAKARVLGNAALEGACMLLKNPALRVKADTIAGLAQVMQLSGNPLFAEKYINHMNF